MKIKEEIKKLKYKVAYVPHKAVKGHLTCYNVKYQGKIIKSGEIAKKLQIPLNEIWISKRLKSRADSVLNHELQEIKYRHMGYSSKKAHEKAKRTQYLILKTPNKKIIRFRFYNKRAPITCKKFTKILPLEVRAVQARFAGEEIWIPKGPNLQIPRENSSVNLKFGEIGYAPVQPRNEISKSIAIVYGKAKLSGRVNVFAKVFDKDRKLLKKLGEQIWLKGARKLKFELSKY